MKKFWLCLILAMCFGTACAWAVNHKRYGHRDAYFGPFSMQRDVTPEVAMKVVDGNVPDALGRVELPNGSDHDFGAMAPNQTGEHSFLVRNVGSGDLTLKIGASTCKCTIGSLEKNAIGPGEETEIKLEWTIAKGTHSSAFSQSAQLITNDPGKVVINLGIGGSVIREIEIVPKAWSFGEVATGEPIEMEGKVYNFFDTDIRPTKMQFSDDYLNELAEFDVQPFEPSEADGIYSGARQGFHVKVKIKAGLRQGAVSQNFVFGFQRLDANGDPIPPAEGDSDPNDYAFASTAGRVIGALGLLSGPIKGVAGGGYIYDFGRIGKDDSLIGKTYVVLKGSERENTKLRIGEIVPDQAIRATLGEPKGRGSMTLYPLEIELVPGDEPIDLLGKNKDDYGSVWIESDNPKITKMRVAVKFLLEPR